MGCSDKPVADSGCLSSGGGKKYKGHHMNPGLGGHQYPETHKLELLKVKREGSSTLLSTGKKLSQDIN